LAKGEGHNRYLARVARKKKKDDIGPEKPDIFKKLSKRQGQCGAESASGTLLTASEIIVRLFTRGAEERVEKGAAGRRREKLVRKSDTIRKARLA